MSLESDLFEKLRPSVKELLSYGFEENDGSYTFAKMIMNDTMKCIVTIDQSLKIQGRIYDDFDEEYVAFRPEGARGEFAASVRREYLQLLEDIADRCYHPVPFISDQTNRINDQIGKIYHDAPEHIFEKFPSYAVYRHKEGKWYGIIMDIKEGTLPDVTEPKEIIDLKIHEDRIPEYLNRKGFYPAFHMNRKNWISVILDDTVDDETIMDLIRESNELTSSQKKDLITNEWIVPANPKYFDLDHAFTVSDLLWWKQSSNVNAGDLVYIYYGAPFKEIRYLCRVIETDRPYLGKDDGPVRFEKLMRLKKLRFFENGLLSREKIAEFGVTNIRGPRYMPVKLKEEICRLYNMEEYENE